MTNMDAFMRRHDLVSACVQAQATHEEHRNHRSAAADAQGILLALELLHDRDAHLRAQ